jgi:hypothetical protein
MERARFLTKQAAALERGRHLGGLAWCEASTGTVCGCAAPQVLSGERHPGLKGLVVAWGPDGPPADALDGGMGEDEEDMLLAQLLHAATAVLRHTGTSCAHTTCVFLSHTSIAFHQLCNRAGCSHAHWRPDCVCVYEREFVWG